MRATLWRWVMAGCVCLGTVAHAQAEAAGSTGDCVLTMGWEPWLPYQFRDEDGVVTGLDIELVGAVVERMGCQLELRRTTWRRSLVEVRQGKLDMVAGANRTEERAAWAYFTEPYRDDRQVLFVRAGEAASLPLTSLADIVAGEFRLGVGRGVYYGAEFERFSKRDDFMQRVYPIDSEIQKYKILTADRIDGFLANPVSMQHLLRSEGDPAAVEVHPLEVYASDLHVMLSKKSASPGLTDRFNASLRTIKDSGAFATIVGKYAQ